MAERPVASTAPDHAVLRPVEDRWTPEDEQSTNGTYADGRRIREWEVGPGTVIRFGYRDYAELRQRRRGPLAEPGGAPGLHSGTRNSAGCDVEQAAAGSPAM
ncbi:FHA domain-containing protein [Streptomyces shenzhenensis]|uniref:FHA domain-containing protein n=1 Tax=Streptomyces shenzhenensis TaxID=943815 RepID=UPI0015F081DA